MSASDRTADGGRAPQGSEGWLSDPPVLPAAAEPPSPVTEHRAAFPEFARGTLPDWALVRQRFDPTEIADVREAVRSALDLVRARIPTGARVCLAVGSRGIDRID